MRNTRLNATPAYLPPPVSRARRRARALVATRFGASVDRCVPYSFASPARGLVEAWWWGRDPPEVKASWEGELGAPRVLPARIPMLRVGPARGSLRRSQQWSHAGNGVRLQADPANATDPWCGGTALTGQLTRALHASLRGGEEARASRK